MSLEGPVTTLRPVIIDALWELDILPQSICSIIILFVLFSISFWSSISIWNFLVYFLLLTGIQHNSLFTLSYNSGMC